MIERIKDLFRGSGGKSVSLRCPRPWSSRVDVERRYRGFLASVMLEIAPGVYVSPDLSAGVRERIWSVLEDWFGALGNGAVSMIWRDGSADGGLALRYLGDPPK